MDRISVAAVVVGLIALFLACVALVAAPEGTGDVRADLAGVKEDLATAGKELVTLKGGIAKLSSGPDETLARVQELRSKVSELSQRTARLDRAVAEAAQRPAAGLPTQVKVDEEMVGRLLREEIRSRFAQMRGPAAGQGRPDMSAKGLREGLGVSEEKAAKLAKVYKERTDSIGKIWRENRGGARDKNIALMREVQKKNDAAVAELLTPEEIKKYQEMRNRGRRGPQGRRPTRPTTRPEGERRPAPAGDTPAF